MPQLVKQAGKRHCRNHQHAALISPRARRSSGSPTWQELTWNWEGAASTAARMVSAVMPGR